MEIVPYLTFNGKAAEAMTWYAEVLGAETVYADPDYWREAVERA